MLISMLATPALALVCDPGDPVCNTANSVRDLVNTVRPNSIGDSLSGKRSTQFVEARLAEIFDTATANGCLGLGIGAVVSDNGLFTGVYQDVDFNTGVVFGGGSYDGAFIDHEFFGAVDGAPGTLGDWGRYHFPSGKLAGLRGAPDIVVAGGVARINGRRSVAWAVHGVCPPDVDAAAALTPYMPQVERYAIPVDPGPDFGSCGPNSPVINSVSYSGDPGTPGLFIDLDFSDVDGDLNPSIGFTLYWDDTPNGVLDAGATMVPLLLTTDPGAPPCSFPSLVGQASLPFDLLQLVVDDLGGTPFPYGQLTDIVLEIADNDTIEGAGPHVTASEVQTICAPLADGTDAVCGPL